MSDMKNIYDVLKEIDFENKCEKYALGFQRNTDTSTMTKFRQESAKQFCFGLIQEFYEKSLGELYRTRKALDVAINYLQDQLSSFDGIEDDRIAKDIRTLLEQINEIKGDKDA